MEIMMKNKKTIIFVILGVIAFIVMLYPSIYWMQNPTLTQMQVFLEFWWLYGILFGSYGLFALHKIFNIFDI